MEWKHHRKVSNEIINSMEGAIYPPGRHSHVLVSYYDYLIMYGGIGIENRYLDDLWIYSIADGKFTFL